MPVRESRAIVEAEHRTGITWRALALGLLFAAIFAWHSVVRENTGRYQILAATQIPVRPFLLLVVGVLLVNPLLKLSRVVKPLATTELMAIFVMCLIASGIPTYGLASHLVPIVAGYANPHWNNDQTKWDIYVEPFLKDRLFICAAGTQEAAERLREATTRLRDARDVYNAARDLSNSRKQHAAAERRLRESRAAGGAEGSAASRQLLERQARIARASLAHAERSWEQFAERHDLAEVGATYEKRIEALSAETDARREELKALKAKAFEEITTFRRGLPKEMRAVPGFIYVPGEGLAGYVARIRRLRVGRSALGRLRRADRLIDEAVRSGGRLDPAFWQHVADAVELLAEIADIPSLSARKHEVDSELGALKQQRVENETRLEELRHTRRFAPAAEYTRLTSEIDDLSATIRETRERIGELEQESDRTITPHLDVCARVVEAREGLSELLRRRATAGLDLEQLKTDLGLRMASFASFDVSLRRFLVGDINWGIWLKPLVAWVIVVLLTYAVLMSFNVLIFRQWAHNEKIIYPLAQLPTVLADRPEASARAIPEIFTRGLFWTGFAVSFLVLTWNFLIKQRIVTGIGEIPLDIWLSPYLRHSFLGAIHRTRFTIFFTLIGLTFLVPARISFSIWFFHVFFMVELLFLVWLGYGVDIRSFPQNESLVLNFRFAQGGGALIVFALVAIYKCRTYILCWLFPRGLEGLAAEERKELEVSSAVFLIASLALVLAFTFLLGANLFYSVLIYLISLVVTIGITRAVTEGGILGIQSHFNPFHLIRSVFGMDKRWTDPALYAPLWVYHVLLYFDIKTFIAPMMANSLKIRDNLKLQRLRFHGSVCGAILCAIVISLATHIVVGYAHGADSMRRWNYGDLVRRTTFGTLKSMTSTHPVDTAGCRWWIVSGAVLMGGVLALRRRVFWVVHPIGMIMFINPLMRGYWGSVLIGWLMKSLVSKYGNKDTYERLRTFFVGLILGELIVCVLGWTTLDRWWGP